MADPNEKVKINQKKMMEALNAGIDAFFKNKTERLKKRVVENTPVKTGNLRRHVRVAPIVKTNSKIETGIEVKNVPYAMQVHEAPETKPMSAMTPEGGVGRKYIERVMQHNFAKTNEKDIMEEMRKVGMELKKL